MMSGYPRRRSRSLTSRLPAGVRPGWTIDLRFYESTRSEANRGTVDDQTNPITARLRDGCLIPIGFAPSEPNPLRLWSDDGTNPIARGTVAPNKPNPSIDPTVRSTDRTQSSCFVSFRAARFGRQRAAVTERSQFRPDRDDLDVIPTTERTQLPGRAKPTTAAPSEPNGVQPTPGRVSLGFAPSEPNRRRSSWGDVVTESERPNRLVQGDAI